MPIPWLFRSKRRRRPAALVLGGGGARGLAHVGVLHVLEELDRRPDLIVGSSIGAVIGAMYAQDPDIHRLRRRLEEFLDSSFFASVGLDAFRRQHENGLFPLIDEWIQGIRMRLSATRALTHEGMIPARVLREGLEMLLEDGDVSACRIPYVCVAVDLLSGETRLLRDGGIREAVAASCSIPGVIAPAVIDGRPLVDGAVTSATPVLEARTAGARTVVVVDVSKDLSDHTAPKVGFEIMQRAGDIAAARCNRTHLEHADHILRPAVHKYHWARFDLAAQFIETGIECARSHENSLRSVFSHPERKP